MDAGGGAASSSGAVKKGSIIIILNIIILKNSKKGGEKVFELSKAVVNELPDPAVYNHPSGVEQLVTRPVVEQLVRGRH